MEFIQTVKLEGPSVEFGESDRTTKLNQERLISLTSWMMILGTIRALCAFADQASVFLNATRFDSVSWSMLSRFVEENQPFLAMGVAWPLLLGIILRRARWPELLPAAGVTFLFLSIGGILELIAEWNHANGRGITIGSFHLTRLAFVRPSRSDVVQGVLGMGQLAVEWRDGSALPDALPPVARINSPGPRIEQARGSSPCSNGTSGNLRLRRLPYTHGPSAGLVDLSRDPQRFKDRERIVLKTDIGPANRPRRTIRMSKEEERMRGLQQMLAAALISTSSRDYLAAKEDYLNLIAEPTLQMKKSGCQGITLSLRTPRTTSRGYSRPVPKRKCAIPTRPSSTLVPRRTRAGDRKLLEYPGRGPLSRRRVGCGVRRLVSFDATSRRRWR